MQVTFLGTSGGVPTTRRNVAGIAVRLPQRGEWWLLDCGEATQHQLLRTDLSFSTLTRIFITHLHGDHIYGLPGLLATGRLAGNASMTHIYAPAGLEDYLRSCWRMNGAEQDFPVEIHTIKAGEIYQDDEFVVTCAPVEHRTTAFAYLIAERDRQGKFRAAEALALGVPFGPLFGKLKRGETITLADGKQIDGRTLIEPPEQGRRVVYSGDTGMCDAMITLARDADLLIHEATFSAYDEHLARRSGHSTTAMAAQVAHAANVKRLLLTHISPRYACGTAIEPEDLLREAQAIFPATDMARDFLRIEIPRRRQSTTEDE